jgi:hypothetical protein
MVGTRKLMFRICTLSGRMCSANRPSKVVMVSNASEPQMRVDMRFSLRSAGREENDVADAGRVGEQHDQPVDADAAAAGGRHAVFQRPYIIGVEIHGFVVAGFLGLHLRLKAGGLVFGVVQLGETVGDFAAGDEQLEALGRIRIGIGGAGQGRHFHRVIDDEGRLPQQMLGDFFNSASCKAPSPMPLSLCGA